jgi:DNA end-binding protein Ku
MESPGAAVLVGERAEIEQVELEPTPRLRSSTRRNHTSMPRAIWTGAISFGLVNVPVRLYGAVAEHTLHFHYVHAKDGSRIGYEKICKAEGEPVPEDEIVKAFEVEEGEFVTMTDEDFEAARVEGYRSIDVHDFVPSDEIDPVYFRHTYYAGPQDGAEKVYALLVEAMEQSGLVGIARFVMRDRQHLGCLRVRDGVLTLEQLYFADEIRPPDEHRPDGAKVEQRELELALRLIDSFSGHFEPEQYRDTYRDALCEVIAAKRRGETLHVPEPTEEEGVPDLMEALRRSIDAAKGGRDRWRDGDLGGKTKAELLELAREAEIPGRSQMDKDELVHALRSA